jgi:DNA repair protein RecO (recombination protein O)
VSRDSRRVELAPAYILHHRPFRDTSRILDVLSREHGRMTLFARGVRAPRSLTASLLRPFVPLLVSWSGRGEAAQLTRVEAALDIASAALPAATLMSCFYLNELLMKLTTRHDPNAHIYDIYDATLVALRGGAPLQICLRLFERDLLEATGFGLELGCDARSGAAVRAEAYYHFRPALGLVEASGADGSALRGSSVLALASGVLGSAEAIDDARRLLRVALDEALEGRELTTRTVARAVLRGPRDAGRQ